MARTLAEESSGQARAPWTTVKLSGFSSSSQVSLAAGSSTVNSWSYSRTSREGAGPRGRAGHPVHHTLGGFLPLKSASYSAVSSVTLPVSGSLVKPVHLMG